MTHARMLDRRGLLQAATVSLLIPVVADAQAPAPAAAPVGPSPNAGPGHIAGFLRIGADGRITLLSPVTELGQGTHTAHAQIVADELGAAIEAITVEVAQPEAAFRYTPPREQYTGASWGVRLVHERLRLAAAQARTLLTEAAARSLSVPVAELRVADGRVTHAVSGRALPFGELVAAAAALPLPEQPVLRLASERRYVGQPVPRLDIPGKVRGAAIYAGDVRLEGMVVAVPRLSPVFGAELEGFDRASVASIAGVIDVVAIPGGAAVVARDTWAAMQGARALAIRWKPTPHDGMDSAALSAMMRIALKDGEARVGKNDGDADAALRDAARVVEANYEVPFLAHACMETDNCTVRIADGRVEVWAPTQHPDWARTAAARAANVAPEAVTVHTTLAGGGFGRRLQVMSIEQATRVAAAVGRPVRLLWTREDDLAQGYYRPAHVARLAAALDGQGRITALTFRSAGLSVMGDYRPPFMARPGALDPFALQAVVDTRYRFGAFRAEWVRVEGPPKSWLWRSVGASQNTFFLESFLDEVAQATGKDPLALRLDLLAHDARAKNVLDVAARTAGWSTPRAAGRHLGIAYSEIYDTLCAQVAEVSVSNGETRVHRVSVAIDCGNDINPNQVAAQVEGSVVQALSALVGEAITLRAGAAEQRNFDTYPLLRMDAAPVVETVIIRSGEKLGGVGEPAMPPVAPAVANAIFAATGQRIRTLPIGGQVVRA